MRSEYYMYIPYHDTYAVLQYIAITNKVYIDN